MATKLEVGMSLHKLSAAHPDHVVSKEQLEAYYQVLKGYKIADLDKSVMTCLATYNNYPSIAALVRNIPRPGDTYRHPTGKPGPCSDAVKALLTNLVDKVDKMPGPPKREPLDWHPPEREPEPPRKLKVDAKAQAKKAGVMQGVFKRMVKGSSPLTEQDMQAEANRVWQQRLLMAHEGRLTPKKEKSET